MTGVSWSPEWQPREYRAHAASISNAELAPWIETLTYRMNDASFSPADREVQNELTRPKLRAAQAEWDRRQRSGVRLPVDLQRNLSAQRRLKDAVKEAVELADLMEREGFPVVRGRSEAHSPCPLCGGTDRFVIRPAPNSFGWCRQCEYSADVIGVARSSWQVSFADAVVALAGEYLGLSVEVAS